MPLTDTAIRQAKPTEKTRKLADAQGLYLELSPAGGKWWRLKYRFEGKEKRLSLGTYPETTLAVARGKRDAARALLRTGVDPSAERKEEKRRTAIAADNSFEAIARELGVSRGRVSQLHKEALARLRSGGTTNAPVDFYF